MLFVRLIIASIALLMLPAQLWSDQEFLPIEKAFGLLAEVRQEGHIVVMFQSEPGYYVYRKRFGFTAATADVKLGDPVFPKGKIQQDEYMEPSEIYRDSVEILLPYSATRNRPKVITLKVKWQGCAEAGLCYPPTTWTRTVDIPSAR